MLQSIQTDEDEVVDLADDEIVIEEEFLHLPKEIATTLSDPAFDLYCNGVAKKYDIPEEKYFDLALCTQYVMSGETTPSEYVKELMATLHIDQPKAALIAQEINKDLFSPLKDALKELYGLNKKTDAIKPNSTVFIPPVIKAVATTPVTTTNPTPITPTSVIKEPQVTPAQVIAPTPMPETKPVLNTLETKLGEAFTIKKDVMFTQPGVASTVAQPTTTPVAQARENPAQVTPPITPVSIAKSDLYREAV